MSWVGNLPLGLCSLGAALLSCWKLWLTDPFLSWSSLRGHPENLRMVLFCWNESAAVSGFFHICEISKHLIES